MIGFEAELSVPTFEPNFGASDNGAIYSFFFCGYADTKKAVGENNLFKIKPDIAAYAVLGQKLLTQLWSVLPVRKAIGAEPKEDLKAKVRITKMEYETFASDETAADSNQKYAEAATAIKAHAGQFAPQAKKEIRQVPEPARGMYAGIPVNEIEAVIQALDTREEQAAKTCAENLRKYLKDMQDSVLPQFAVQATAGIFPSVIPQLFENAEKPLDQPFEPKLREAWQTAYPLIRKLVETAMNDETFSNHEWVQANLKEEVRRLAFKGHLYLLCSYLVGDALSRTALFEKMSAKNAVPYHSKINLGNFYKAMPGEGGPKPPNDLAGWIAEKLTGERPKTAQKPSTVEESDDKELATEEPDAGESARRKITDFMTTEFWLDKLEVKENTSKERLVHNAPDDFVFKAITRDRVATFINPLGLDRGQTFKTKRGENGVVDEHRDPDAEPRSRDGERGVQLEFRRLGAEGVDLKELKAAVMTVVNKVRELNLPRMPAEHEVQIRALIAASSSG